MKINRLIEEPYRIFFPLGVLAGMFGVSHWFLYSLGLLPAYSPVFHSSVQVQLYVSLFIFGFLMTAGPRFAGAAPARPREVFVFLLLFSGMFVCLFFQRWAFSDVLFCALLLRLAYFLFQRIKDSSYQPPTEFVWIPVGLLCGLLGAALSAAVLWGFLPAEILAVGKVMKEQGFVLCIVLGVGGFLGPRLLGFSRLLNPSELRSIAAAQNKRRKRILIHLVAGLVLLVTFYVEGNGRSQMAYLLRALIVSAEILWTTRIFLRPVATELFARLLWLSLWMVVLGYWACVFWPLQRKEMLHIVFIGGFSLMIIAVATMVVFSHAGEPEKLKRSSWVLRASAAGLFSAFLFRVIAVFFPVSYFSILGVAAVCWLAAGVCWLCLVAPRLVRHVQTGSDRC